MQSRIRNIYAFKLRANIKLAIIDFKGQNSPSNEPDMEAFEMRNLIMSGHIEYSTI